MIVRDRAPADLDQLQAGANNLVKFADAAFAPKWKPNDVTADDWNKARQIEVGLGHKALAWCFIQRKDGDPAHKEAALSLQADPDQPDVAAFLRK